MILKEKTKTIKKFFFINKQVIEVLCKNFEILIINCTYKTNKYRMFLLTIIKHIVIDFIFIINFVFLIKKIASYYDWILNHLKILYISLKLVNSRVIVMNRNLILMKVINIQYFAKTKHVLCFWHVYRNVIKNCKTFFSIKKNWKTFLIDWHAIIYVFNKTKFETTWRALIIKWYNINFEDVSYLYKTWLMLLLWYIKYFREYRCYRDKIEVKSKKIAFLTRCI